MEFAVVWHSQRRKKILAILQAGANARTADIARALGVSRETVRRDLMALESQGLLDRVHGGAVANEHETEARFEKRRRLNWSEKQEIARKAADILSPGMIVFVDAGTTTLALADQLRNRPEITVITNSLSVAEVLGTEALLLGGRIVSDVPACFGELTLSQIERFRADLAFISPTAVHPEIGVMYYELHESEVARAMCEGARESIVLADSSKLGVTSRVVMAGLSSVHRLISEEGVEPALRRQIDAALGTPLHRADASSRTT